MVDPVVEARFWAKVAFGTGADDCCPDHVCCVRTGIKDDATTWCGRRPHVLEWCFEDASHAAVNGRNKGRLVACPECVEAIGEALRNGEEDASSTAPAGIPNTKAKK